MAVPLHLRRMPIEGFEGPDEDAAGDFRRFRR